MAEKRLIDANAACDRCRMKNSGNCGCCIIGTAPTVDAVEVVRCKDCEQWGGVTFGNVCRRWSAPLAGMKNCTKPDDFCSYVERRSNA